MATSGRRWFPLPRSGHAFQAAVAAESTPAARRSPSTRKHPLDCFKGLRKLKAGKSAATVRIVPQAGGADGKARLVVQPGSGYAVDPAARKVKTLITDCSVGVVPDPAKAGPKCLAKLRCMPQPVPDSDKIMPIYKVSKYEEQEQRERVVHGRLRLVTLLVSGLLFVATAVLLLSHVVHHPA